MDSDDTSVPGLACVADGNGHEVSPLDQSIVEELDKLLDNCDPPDAFNTPEASPLTPDAPRYQSDPNGSQVLSTDHGELRNHNSSSILALPSDAVDFMRSPFDRPISYGPIGSWNGVTPLLDIDLPAVPLSPIPDDSVVLEVAPPPPFPLSIFLRALTNNLGCFPFDIEA